MKHKEFHPFTNISALRLSLTISILLNAILSLGYVYNKNFGPISGFRLFTAFLSDFVMFYLLYMFNFKTLLQSWKKPIKGWIIIIGSLIIAIILSLIFTNFAIQFLPPIPVPDNFLLITNLIKGLIIYVMVLL